MTNTREERVALIARLWTLANAEGGGPVCDALEEAARALEPSPDVWEAIETAPRDGASIIGGYFNQPWAESHREGDITKCWFQPEFNAFISSCREMVLAADYKFEDGSARQLHSPVIEEVTHWRPLPDPPKVTVEEDTK